MNKTWILFGLLVAVVAVTALPAQNPGAIPNFDEEDVEDVEVALSDTDDVDALLPLDVDRAKRSADPQRGYYGQGGRHEGYGGHNNGGHHGGSRQGYGGHNNGGYHGGGHNGGHYRGRRSADPEPQWGYGGYGGYGGGGYGGGGYGGGYGGYGGHRGGYGGHRGGYGRGYGGHGHHRGGYYG